MSRHILVVFGTRPEAIKLFPVVRALQRREGVVVQTLATGQHDILLEQVLDLHDVRPDLALDLVRPDASLDALHAALVPAIGDAIDLVRPDIVVVQGDTATAHAAALAAVHRQIPVAHVEAGLRSGDTAHPWPEEQYRRAITAYASLHFAPTSAAGKVLRDEGIAAARIFVTGNTVIDTLLATRARIARDPSLAQAAASIIAAADGRPIVLATAHRRENAAWMHVIGTALRLLARDGNALVVLVGHPNPASSTAFARLLGIANLVVSEPLDHAAFIALLDRAALVVTDSGGVQEEAASLGTPALVLRRATERREGIEAGLARLVPADDATMIAAAAKAMLDAPPITATDCYGDGRAGERIADTLVDPTLAAAVTAPT